MSKAVAMKVERTDVRPTLYFESCVTPARQTLAAVWCLSVPPACLLCGCRWFILKIEKKHAFAKLHVCVLTERLTDETVVSVCPAVLRHRHGSGLIVGGAAGRGGRGKSRW